MNRRDFCEKALLAAGAFPFLTHAGVAGDSSGKQKFQYKPIIPRNPSDAKAGVPEEFRIAFGRDYFSLNSADEGVLFDCVDLPAGSKAKAFLRLQVAIDTRNEDEVEVYLARSGKKIGHLSIWYPTGLQIFETPLDCTVDSLRNEGIRFKLLGGSYDVFFFSFSSDNGSHLLLVEEDWKAGFPDEEWQNLLCSDRSLQPFGWTEGCTLDGLQELYMRKNDMNALRAIKQHLGYYLPDEKNLVYVDLWARPKDNTFTNLEAGLPFATIARYQSSHASVELFVNFCKERFGEDGRYKPDGLSTEGCYTLAYPLTALGTALKAPGLYEMALLELEQRIRYLTDDGAVYNIGSISKGKTRIRRNWGRGYVWFLLGIVRCGEILQNESPLKNDPRVGRLKEVYRHYAHIALSFMQPDHSWKAYLDQPETRFESSATAGLAAAFAHGHRIGWLPEFSQKDLLAVYNRVLKSTTADGFLTDVTQHNAGSINLLQRGSYRVIAQYAIGFLGHIKAHL